MAYLKTSGTRLLWDDGSPVHELGVNGYSLFWRLLDNNSDTTYVTAFTAMQARGIRVIRVSLCPWSDNSFFESNLASWRALVDAFLASAQAHNVTVIFSLFFNIRGIPDWKGEAYSAWSNPASATRVHTSAVIAELTSRYLNHAALAGYEMGNEWDSYCTDYGGGATAFTSTVMSTGYAQMATEIRAGDANRIIMSGNVVTTATVPKDKESLVKRLLVDNPSPMDTITIHPYKAPSAWSGFFGTDYSGIRGLLQLCKRTGKAVVVGEFGVNEGETFTQPSVTVQSAWRRSLFEVTLADLAMVWNMDISDYSGNQTGWFSWPGNNRQYVLDDVGSARQPAV